MSGDFSLTWFTSIGFRSFFATSGPFFGNRNLPTNRDVAIGVGTGRIEYAKRVYGASCIRLTAADVQKCSQDLVNWRFVGKASQAVVIVVCGFSFVNPQ